MFLFNPYRNSRQPFACGNEVIEVNWKTDLRTNPVFGAESTAAIDETGNLYFGSHSGNFYSLTKNGDIRWVFTTKVKIYSSPLYHNNIVFFAGGDGFMYALSSKCGTEIWKKDLSESLRLTRKKKLISLLQHLPYTFDLKRKRNIVYRSWASPNIMNHRILVTGYGKGLFCFSPEGETLWEYDLGFPRHQLSGVAIDRKDRIFCASRNGFIHCISKEGELIWEKKVKHQGEPWGNPAYCDQKDRVYFSFANKERSGLVYAFSSDGAYLWQLKIGAIRGGTAISHNSDTLYCCDLDGFIYKIDALSGEIRQKKRITKCARGLWITPTIDAEGNILLATKDNSDTGRVIKLNTDFEYIWTFNAHKVLSVPVILSNGDVLFGSWDGHYYSIKTKV